MIGNFNQMIFFEIDIDVVGNVKCDIIFFKQGVGLNMFVIVMVYVLVMFNIDQNSFIRDLCIDFGDIDFDLCDFDFNFVGNWKCVVVIGL